MSDEKPDFLDEMIAERSKTDPNFEEAIARRRAARETAPDKYVRLPYFRKVKALTTLVRAESYLREHIMLGSLVGMFTEGSITEANAKEALATASAYLNGEKDDELRKWIDVESAAVESK